MRTLVNMAPLRLVEDMPGYTERCGPILSIGLAIDEAVDRAIEQGAPIWGRDDCVMWLADILVAAGHPDPVRDFRGHYKTLIGYRRLLKRHGFATLDDALIAAARRMKWRRASPLSAPLGSVGVGPHGRTCWMKQSADMWVARSDRGVVFNQSGIIEKAWAIA